MATRRKTPYRKVDNYASSIWQRLMELSNAAIEKDMKKRDKFRLDVYAYHPRRTPSARMPQRSHRLRSWRV